MAPAWILILVGIVIIGFAVGFAFWFFPENGNGNWWKPLNWDDRNEKRYD